MSALLLKGLPCVLHCSVASNGLVFAPSARDGTDEKFGISCWASFRIRTSWGGYGHLQCDAAQFTQDISSLHVFLPSFLLLAYLSFSYPSLTFPYRCRSHRNGSSFTPSFWKPRNVNKMCLIVSNPRPLISYSPARHRPLLRNKLFRNVQPTRRVRIHTYHGRVVDGRVSWCPIMRSVLASSQCLLPF